MSLLLFEFVQWLESSYGHPQNVKLSDFAIEPPPETLAMAEMALEVAINSNFTVTLETQVSIKSIISFLVLRRVLQVRSRVAGNLPANFFRVRDSPLSRQFLNFLGR